jgi:hypothetical protein
MRLCHPPDDSTSPKYKLLCFKPPQFILPNTECNGFKLGYVLPSFALFTVASFPLNKYLLKLLLPVMIPILLVNLEKHQAISYLPL